MRIRLSNIFFLLFPAFFLVSSCSSQKAAIEDQKPLANSLLWKIEHPDLAEPSYLFGTIHMIPKEDFFYPTGLEEAYKKADKLVFEIDMDEMTGLGSLMGLLGNIMMKGGTTIDDLLSPSEYKEVANYFEEMGLPMMLLNRVKPMFLSMLAEVGMNPQDMAGGSDVLSYEMELYDRAQSDSKDVDGLETMGYQMSIFDSIPYKDQAMMLLDAVRGTTGEGDNFDATVELYRSQNIEAMVQMVVESEDTGNYEDILLKNRNQNWIPVMSKMMTTGPVLFAVGAGHLAGENGVIRLLKKQGYKLTPLSAQKTSAAKHRV